MLAPPLRWRGQFRAPALVPSERKHVQSEARRNYRSAHRSKRHSSDRRWHGQAHRFAAQLLAAGRNGRLAMDRLPYAGQMATLSGDATSFVTDSAAAATAIATGVKTLNGSVSIDLKGQEQMTILELARDSGRAVGLVSTCQITDATPAAFAAHVPHRADQSEVARQYIERTRVDVILGGARLTGTHMARHCHAP